MRLIDADKLHPDCLTKDGTLAISQSQIANAETVIPEEIKPLIDKVMDILPDLTDAIIEQLPKIISSTIKCSECPYYKATWMEVLTMTNKQAINILLTLPLQVPSDGELVDIQTAIRMATWALMSIDKIKDEAERVKADNIILTKRLNDKFVSAKTNPLDYYRDGYKSGFEDGFVKGLGLQNAPKIKIMLNGEEINQEGTK